MARPVQLGHDLTRGRSVLRAEHVAALDAMTEPAFILPAAMLRVIGMFSSGGLTVNGPSAPPWPMAPRTDADRY